MYYKLRYGLGKMKLRVMELLRTRAYLSGQSQTRNFQELQRLRGKFEGQRCFIVGNGPSLKQLDLSFLKNEHSFLFNGAYELIDQYDFQKAYLAIEDRLVMEDHSKFVNELELPTFIPSDLMHLVTSDSVIETYFSRSTSERSKNWPPFVDPKADRPVFYWGGTVAFYGLQLAAWMGFSQCYVIGVDLTYTIPNHVTQKGSVLLSNGDDPNHYDIGYFGKGKRWHVPKPERMLTAFRSVNSRPVTNNMHIFNAGVGGNLDCFERVEFDALFE